MRRFHARAWGDTGKTTAEKCQPTTESGGLRTRTVALQRQERCAAQLFLLKEKVSESAFQALAEFPRLADSQGSKSTEEARDMADDYINVITGRFYRSYQNFEDKQAAKHSFGSTRISLS